MLDEVCEGRAHHGDPLRGATVNVGGSLRALEASLAEASDESAAVRDQRRQTDAAMIDFLRRKDFQGPYYREFMQTLMEYGWRILSGWSANGLIFDRVARAGRPIPTTMVTTAWADDERSQVVTDTVIKGSTLFHEHGLVRGKWTPDGGASLTTYFVGAALLAFSPVYIKWYKAYRLGQSELDHRTTGEDDILRAQRDIPDQRATDPAHIAVVHDDIAQLKSLLPDEKLRGALALMALGYSQVEAAAEVGLTTKALEGRLARARTKVSASRSIRVGLEEGGAR
ncbi:RNA polymerase sigma factor [Streptomyces erythrochromogenes]|uniref:sigma-70 family RNA polymerase sigma factor n=1 Tax=Streptomyces erythrochromogenes TaxID=285574 RepID=UPI0036AD5399